MKKAQLKNRIDVANKRKKADLVIRHASIVNVYTKSLTAGDVAITDGVIVGIGDYEGVQEIDATGKFIAPGLIDAHVHIESSMVTPPQFSQVVLSHGVTTVITDPHEIANVKGTAGLEFMLKDAEQAMLDIKMMLPSCVPATPFENAGARLSAEDLVPFTSRDSVLGLAEVMNFPAVLQGDEAMLDKLLLSRQIDGHAAGLTDNDINVYGTAGILTDHECVTKDEMTARIERGLYVMLREGSVAKDLHALLEGVTEQNAHRCLFCTDDKHLDDLIDEGSVNHNVRTAIRSGINPITAISMATLNAAQCFGLHQKGAIAPGYDADFIVLDNLEEFTIDEVYKGGQLAAKDGRYAGPVQEDSETATVRDTVRIAGLSTENLQIPMEANASAHIIGINPNKLITEHLIEKVSVAGGYFVSDAASDHLKIAVIERHRATGNIGLGIVKGLGLQDGAIATTVAHDSHNIIVVGTNDEDMLAAIRALQELQGGLAVVQNCKVLASLSLPIAGLMSDQPFPAVYSQLKAIDQGLLQIGAPTHFNAFLTLSFLSLPVIPHLKLTDRGLFDVASFRHIEVVVRGE
ncbi:adenine deaminase [Planococcus sp. CP5-4]|uniref:adenine deaminase n=1 Tax=unclassified Planococcus (in: firmicutes) TaxID=2662419 RepID=UPI001C230C89|nr:MULTISPECIES: adenine deaminase [unclassified Planococcus (in: firmicutes)]MBU9673793.1 adenine deaminase [Planococcus sp. CP5-4_YE]MBV0908921.1 adenine deaminase [Planococcus sp. CP5-4_UN]MBW6063970.1 adenine deaminase [Planococcus sp. CP5-4]